MPGTLDGFGAYDGDNMAVIAFANTKGGSGKTTAAAVLVSELLAAGAKVVLIEGDPNAPLSRWAASRKTPMIDAAQVHEDPSTEMIRDAAGDSRLVVVRAVDANDPVEEWIAAATGWAQFVVTDPEGSPNMWMVSTITQADLVLVPFAPTTLDSHQVVTTVKQINRTAQLGKKTPYRVLITRSNPGAVITRDEHEIRKSLAKAELPLMVATLQDRPAFRAIFKSASLLSELDPETHKVNGLDQARTNAAAFAAEVLEVLRTLKSDERPAA